MTAIKTPSSFKTVFSAARKLYNIEKKILGLQLFSADALCVIKVFEARLKKKKLLVLYKENNIVLPGIEHFFICIHHHLLAGIIPIHADNFFIGHLYTPPTINIIFTGRNQSNTWQYFI